MVDLRKRLLRYLSVSMCRSRYATPVCSLSKRRCRSLKMDSRLASVMPYIAISPALRPSSTRANSAASECALVGTRATSVEPELSSSTIAAPASTRRARAAGADASLAHLQSTMKWREKRGVIGLRPANRGTEACRAP